MPKKQEKNNEPEAPSLKVPLLGSLWEDDGRRVLLILLAVMSIGIILVLLLNLIYLPSRGKELFSGLEQMRTSSNRIIIPTGFLMAVMSLLFFSLSGTYGRYTEVTLGKKKTHARSLFRKLSFYFALIGAAFLLSGGIADSMAGYS